MKNESLIVFLARKKANQWIKQYESHNLRKIQFIATIRDEYTRPNQYMYQQNKTARVASRVYFF